MRISYNKPKTKTLEVFVSAHIIVTSTYRAIPDRQTFDIDNSRQATEEMSVDAKKMFNNTSLWED